MTVTVLIVAVSTEVLSNRAANSSSRTDAVASGASGTARETHTEWDSGANSESGKKNLYIPAHRFCKLFQLVDSFKLIDSLWQVKHSLFQRNRRENLLAPTT